MKTIEAIKIRNSTRTFSQDSLQPKAIEKIKELAKGEEVVGPFGHKSKFYFLPVVNKNQSKTGEKIGTYGFIKNQKGYVVGVTENNKEAFIDYGYSLEKIIVELTKHDIGTCWLGGTFQRQNFNKVINIQEKEKIPAITPVGYSSEKRRFKDRLIRYLAKADQRKGWEVLFFENNFETSLTKENANELETAFEMVRIGPSGSNKQTWRLLKDDSKVHFYTEFSPSVYKNEEQSKQQLLDIGIAMYHFEATLDYQGKQGKFIKENPNIKTPNRYYSYLATFVLKT